MTEKILSKTTCYGRFALFFCKKNASIRRVPQVRTPTGAFRERAYGGSRQLGRDAPRMGKNKYFSGHGSHRPGTTGERVMTHSYGCITSTTARKTKLHKTSGDRENSCRTRDSFRLCLRINPDNPKHHLWNNNGTWYIHYTAGDSVRAERVRFSLHTKNLATAQRRRDAILRQKGTK